MAKPPPPRDKLDYEAMAQDALRGVVKMALKHAASPQGLPGDHQLYISFKTKGQGVSVPPELLAQYPDEMTIVLQHQFWDLAPGETFFAVTLKFGGQPKRLSIPYAAMTRFFDPYAHFQVQFEAPTPEAEPDVPAEAAAPGLPAPEPVPGPEGETKVVSLDQFRKK